MKEICIQEESVLRRTFYSRCLITALVIMIAYLLTRCLALQADSVRLFALIAILFCVLLYNPIFTKDQQNKYRKIIKIIIYIGIILRIIYMLNTPWYVRPHDVTPIDLDNGGGGAYILNLILYQRLPESNYWQYYHQPFYFIVAACVSSILNGILGTMNDTEQLIDAAKTVSCFAACFSLYGADFLFDICGLRGKSKCTALAVVSFLPACIITGGTIAVDSMTMLMMELVLLETLIWYKKPDYSHTMILAVTCGLAVLTKISCATMCLFTALVMLLVLYRTTDKKEFFVNLADFCVVSLPLGLWYAVRNRIKFNQEFLFVPSSAESNPLYCGNRSLVSRILLFNIKDFLSSPYADPRQTFNLPVYLVKSALFGEFSFDSIPISLACMILILGSILVFCIIYAVIQGFRSTEHLPKIFSALCIFYIVLAVIFFIKFPFGCSQDFRYYLILGVLTAGLLGNQQQSDNKITLLQQFALVTFIPCCTIFFLLV